MIKKISDLYEIASKKQDKKKLALAVADDLHSLEAVYIAYKKNIIIPILIGDKPAIKLIAEQKNFDISEIEIIDEANKIKAVKLAVTLVSSKKADILMKGNVPTAVLLRAVLNDEWGLKTGNLLSHLAVFELEKYHKLISLTDVAMNISPNLKEKAGIVANSANYLNKIGIKKPKVAAIAAVELVNEKMQATVDAAILSKMAQRGQIQNCTIDGPLAFDNAMSKESAEHKKIISEVAGDADILLVPNIETGNVLYKSFAFNGANPASLILGAKAPIVLTSRSDSEQTKLNSIVLAAV